MPSSRWMNRSRSPRPTAICRRRAFSRLTVGTVLTRGDLMHLALMSSENRAAHALGNNYPGGMPAMVRAMNAKAAALGMTSAHFVDPTGLSSENVASPEDSVQAGDRRLAESPPSASTRPTRATPCGCTGTWSSSAIPTTWWPIPTWNIIVQKTGYIAEAGKCLVMEAVIEGRNVVIVLLDSFGKYTRVADAKRVKSWMEASSRTQRVQVSMR